MEAICSWTGVNRKWYAITTLMGFAFIFLSDWLIHGMWLTENYAQTQNLWRSPAEMEAFFPWMTAFQFLIAAVTAFIFTRNYEDKGMWEGVRFGVMLGALWAIWMAMPYAYMPISMTLAWKWAAAGFVQGLGLGLVYSWIYKS